MLIEVIRIRSLFPVYVLISKLTYLTQGKENAFEESCWLEQSFPHGLPTKQT